MSDIDLTTNTAGDVHHLCTTTPETAPPSTQEQGDQSPCDTTPIATAPKRGGAPQGNGNAVKHGLRTANCHPDYKAVESNVFAFRSYLRQRVVEVHGELDVRHDALTQSAARHERRAQLAERWLRLGGDSLPLDERLSLLKAISDASDSRDKVLERLQIDASQQADPFALAISAITGTSPNASGATREGE